MINRTALAVLTLAALIAIAANGASATLRRGVDRMVALENALVVGCVGASRW
jgi:hypothetical protein